MLLASEAATPLGTKSDPDFRAGGNVQRGRCGNQKLLADIDDVVAMAAQIGLTPH